MSGRPSHEEIFLFHQYCGRFNCQESLHYAGAVGRASLRVSSFFFVAAAATLPNKLSILRGEAAASTTERFVQSTPSPAASLTVEALCSAGTAAASLTKDVSKRRPLHELSLSGRRRLSHLYREFGKSVFACTVRGGDYIM